MPENAIDPTLPEVIKPHLYAVDEYQTCDLLRLETPQYTSKHWLAIIRNGYTWDTQEFEIENPDAYEPPTVIVDAYRNYRGYAKYAKVEPGPWQLVSENLFYRQFIPGNPTYYEVEGNYALHLNWDDPAIEIGPQPSHFKKPEIPKLPFPEETGGYERITDGLELREVTKKGSQTELLIQRFTPWNYSWAEGWVQKIFNYFTNNELFFAWAKAYTYTWRGRDDDRWLIFHESGALDNNPVMPGFARFEWKKKFIDFHEYNTELKNFPELTIISQETQSIFITYLAEDAGFYSKQYSEIFLGKGENKVKLNFNNHWALVGSVVVSSSGLDESPKSVIEAEITKKGKHLLYSNLDSFLNFLDESFTFPVDEWRDTYQDARFSIFHNTVNTSEYSSIYFANNNYWKNGNIFIDVNPKPGIKPYASYPATYADLFSYANSIYGDPDYEMPDSIRIQEIHASLNATKYGKDSPKANLGFYIEFISQILGGSFNKDGTTRSVRQMKRIPDGSTVPPGWDRAQFSINERGKSEGQVGGNAGEFAPGIVYQQRTNKLIPDKFDPDASQIEGGDLILCENIPQLLEAILDDISKGLGMQDAGAGAIPNADGSGKIITYEGLHQLLVEIAFALSRVSGHTSETLISSMITQAVSKECLAALGVPLDTGSIGFDTSEGKGYVPYPILAGDGVTITTQMGWILQNLGRLVLASVTPKPIADNQ